VCLGHGVGRPAHARVGNRVVFPARPTPSTLGAARLNWNAPRSAGRATAVRAGRGEAPDR
jgi:hypothetical protein